MAARERWCNDKISKLLIEDLRIPTLNDIKEHFASIPQDEAALTANVLQLSSIFDCLNDSNSEQIDLACEVLATCMSNLNLGDITNRYCIPLERALNHPYPAVKIMALKEIQRNTTNEVLIQTLIKKTALITAVIKCIGDEDLSVVKIASNIIFKVGLSSSGIQHLLEKDILQALHDVIGISGVIRLRINSVLIEMSSTSETTMHALESAGLISPILEDLDNNDVLLKMNVIELLSQLVITKHGYTYLQSRGVITKIFKHLENDDFLTAQLCEPGILKFFGKMAFWKPLEMISKYPVVVDKLFNNIDSDDLTLIGVSLDTFGHVAATNEGKFALDSTGDKVLTALKAIRERNSIYPTELQIRALNCLAGVLRIDEFDSRITNLVRKWFYAMGENPMDFIYKFAQNPFVEIRLAGLCVLNAMALHHWGQECFRNTAGFVEFLLDRRVERFKECKEMKFDIVKTLSTSTVFDHSAQLRLQQFVKEGPFYVQAITEVAIEGED